MKIGRSGENMAHMENEYAKKLEVEIVYLG